jgi:hypothetical protein
MVFLAHMGKIEIAEAIVLIKTDQQAFISHRDVARHGVLLGGRFPALEGPPFYSKPAAVFKKGFDGRGWRGEIFFWGGGGLV